MGTVEPVWAPCLQRQHLSNLEGQWGAQIAVSGPGSHVNRLELVVFVRSFSPILPNGETHSDQGSDVSGIR